MTTILSLLAIALSALTVQAAPTTENIALARKYAPEFRFHQDEVYWPSTVEYFLQFAHLEDGSGNRPTQPSPLTLANLDDVHSQGANTFLTTDINNGKGSFLRGQNPSTSATKPATYTFVVPKSNGVVDIFYWQFSPFNEAKKVPVVGQVGDHVGDWERITVRTVNGVATQVDYHAHSNTGSGTLPWDQVPKFDNNQRPAAYVAKGSHGMWSAAGTFTYVNAVVFKLQDVTSDSGVKWDSKDSIIPLSYPDSYPDNLGWLNFKGRWGNKGTSNCWWHFIYSECEITDGPGGPVRDDVLSAASAKTAASTKAVGTEDAVSTVNKVASKFQMTGPLSQTLGTVSDTAESSYLIRLASPPLASQFATVEQQCGTFNETSQETTYVSSLFSSTPLNAKPTQYTLSVPACADGTIVAAYAVGICTEASADGTGCTFASPRSLRAYTPGVMGIQRVAAINVDDLDDWEL